MLYIGLATLEESSTYMNFEMGLAHYRVCGLVLEHHSAEYKGLRFNSSWGLRIFFLVPLS